MSELKRSHGMGKLRVRRSAKVCFAVACKVIACKIKRLSKVYEGSSDALKRFLKLILGRSGALEATVKQFIRYLQTNQTRQLKPTA